MDSAVALQSRVVDLPAADSTAADLLAAVAASMAEAAAGDGKSA
jgi:hypothetical protein